MCEATVIHSLKSKPYNPFSSAWYKRTMWKVKGTERRNYSITVAGLQTMLHSPLSRFHNSWASTLYTLLQYLLLHYLLLHSVFVASLEIESRTAFSNASHYPNIPWMFRPWMEDPLEGLSPILFNQSPSMPSPCTKNSTVTPMSLYLQPLLKDQRPTICPSKEGKPNCFTGTPPLDSHRRKI